MFKINDIVLYKQDNVKLIGIINSLDYLDYDNSYELITLENFQYNQLIKKDNILKRIGHNDDFQFKNDKSNHIFKIGDVIQFTFSRKKNKRILGIFKS